MAALTTLGVFRTSMEGTIPSQIGNILKLDKLHLNDANLSGSIPSEVGKLKRLQELVLQNNPKINGTMPEELFNASSLRIVQFYNTSLAGSISSGFGRLSYLGSTSWMLQAHLKIYIRNTHHVSILLQICPSHQLC